VFDARARFLRPGAGAGNASLYDGDHDKYGPFHPRHLASLA
jgi:hypothetical protein